MGLKANMSRNNGQNVEEINFANMSRNTSQYVEEFFVDILEVPIFAAVTSTENSSARDDP